ncbi:MAG: hypothetical protein ACXAE3_09585 [Candidatus Kariarchaeaceae archaeon]|jgi:hypothetical protein
MSQYCSIHTRVELQNGKCVACGDIPVVIEKPMRDRTRIKILLFVYGSFFAVLALIGWIRSG